MNIHIEYDQKTKFWSIHVGAFSRLLVEDETCYLVDVDFEKNEIHIDNVIFRDMNKK